jgi:hypothetical protein
LFRIADERETVDCGVEDPVFVVPVAAIDIEQSMILEFSEPIAKSQILKPLSSEKFTRKQRKVDDAEL